MWHKILYTAKFEYKLSTIQQMFTFSYVSMVPDLVNSYQTCNNFSIKEKKKKKRWLQWLFFAMVSRGLRLYLQSISFTFPYSVIWQTHLLPQHCMTKIPASHYKYIIQLHDTYWGTDRQTNGQTTRRTDERRRWKHCLHLCWTAVAYGHCRNLNYEHTRNDFVTNQYLSSLNNFLRI